MVPRGAHGGGSCLTPEGGGSASNRAKSPKGGAGLTEQQRYKVPRANAIRMLDLDRT